jgi:subtilisin family serine protease
MDYRMKLTAVFICTALLAGSLIQVSAFAKSTGSTPARPDKQRYIVVLQDPPLAAYDGRILMTPERDAISTWLPPTANAFTGASKLDVNSPRSRQYLQFLDERFEFVRGVAALKLGRQLNTTHRYRNAVNGFATELTEQEVVDLRNTDGVKEVRIDEIQRLETDSGPNWIGADEIYAGSAGFNATGGEGVVVGLIDSGVNWGHASFKDLGDGLPSSSGSWDHENPYPGQLGLCTDDEVECNDKLVGVYDFVEDDPGTDEIEENNNGRDNSGHGSHVASTAAGNPRGVTASGKLLNIAGVAPNANIVSYRACYIGDPDDLEDDGCQTSAILRAIEQAITDQVDVLNYSIGSDSVDPWGTGTTARAFLNVRAAGIFAATSASNSGPNPSTIGGPANAPWITAVGSATHDRVFGSLVRQLSGGSTTAPGELLGASLTDGKSVTKIVHARDYGNALCGIGEPELNPDCESSTGSTNPFSPGTFNGEIVVCDRGDYGRVEKGKNVMLAGAGGYILANNAEFGESLVADDHCLPATHIGLSDGDKMREWLANGSGHQGSISGLRVLHVEEAADQISDFSSRGPNLPPVEDILKPDLIAPGSSILAAYAPDGGSFAFLSGTSMASPHVTGAAALIKSVHPDWTPAMIASALTMTSTPELAIDFNGSEATPHKRGAGRPRLEEAVNAALFVDETKNGFLAANPRQGGDPKDLNLPGLVDSACRNECNFSRTVTDLVGGASWTASAEGFADGVVVDVSPQNFTLSSGASRLLSIDIDLRNAQVIGSWVYGEIRLSSSGHPDAVFTVAVFADGGQVPTEWIINSDDVSGWQEFSLSGLAAMPDATFTSGGLVEPTETVASLVEDPNNDSPYDDSAGLLAISINVPPDTLWLHTETLESTAADLDLFVGLDVNGDGRAQESEELCSSTSPTELELCDLFAPVAGDYWVIVQNWRATNNPDDVTLKTAVIGKNTLSRLTATGNGIVAAGASQKVRVAWDNVGARPDTELIGAVGIGTHRESPNNVGIIPVTFNKTAVADPETLALMNGVSREITVKGGGMHNMAFIDIPPGADSLTVTASGKGAQQSEDLEIELYRMSFDAAFANAPDVVAPNMSGNPIASAMGGNGSGPTVTVSDGSLTPGRWYPVVRNNRAFHSAVEIRADVSSSGSAIPLHAGLWEVDSRSGGGIGQGYDYASTGSFRALLWYTYDEDGNSDWYLGAAAEPEGNIWVAQIDRYTNDGLLQHASPVGYVSVTAIAEDDHIFSFVLHGKNGSDRMKAISPHICPTINNSEQSYTGLWSRPEIGVGGASGLVNGTSQAFIHFIYDDDGNPRWLLTSPSPQSPTATEMPMLQFKGFCAVCNETAIPGPETVGVFSRDFADENLMTWTLDYVFNPPLSGSVKRTDEAEKLTLRLDCN